MQKLDPEQLNEPEYALLGGSFHPQRLQRRARGVILSAAVMLVGVVVLLQYGLTVPWFAALTIAVLMVSATEKILYHRQMQTYESLITKLTHRIERLEGVPLTPQNGEPMRPAKPDL